MDDGVATVGVDGKIALLAGVDVDASVSVDTKPAQEAVVSTGEAVVDTTTHVVEQAAAPVNNAISVVDKSVSSGAKKVKKKLKFW
jgi:hypothetical protein